MSWVDVQDAMHQAVVLASGFSADKVVWSYQNVGERDAPYVRIHFGGEIPVGLDRVASNTDLTRPAGQEILQEVRGVREVPFTLEVFTDEILGDDAAQRIAGRISTKMTLESIRGRLRKAKVVPFDEGAVIYVPSVYGANFRARAACILRCYVPTMDCLEYVGYIARVRGMITVHGLIGAYGASGIPFDSAGETTASSIARPVYYGGADIPVTYDEAFIMSLAGAMATSRAGSYVIAAGSALYSHVAMPTSFGASIQGMSDAATGEDSGMQLVASAVDVAGAPYDVFCTDVPGLGTWTLEVI